MTCTAIWGLTCDLKMPHETLRCEWPTEVKVTEIPDHSPDHRRVNEVFWTRYVFNTRQQVQVSFQSSYLCLSLIIFLPFDTLPLVERTLLWTVYVCLVVYVQTSALQMETIRITYICPHVPYMFDAMWHIGHPSHSHLRLFLSLIHDVHSLQNIL